MALPKIKPYTYVDREHSNRVSWPVDPSRAVLLVHDMQVHFVQAFEGANLGEGNDNPDAQINIAIRNLRRLIDAAHAAGIPVYYTAQPPRQNPEDRRLLIDFWGDGLQNDESARVLDELAPTDRDTVLTKWRYSAFMRDIQPFMVADALADFSEEEHRIACEYASGRCARVLNTSDVLADLQTAEGAEKAETAEDARA